MLGLVVNPVAGVGGPAGLGGSDGAAAQASAAERGAQPRAGERARLALELVHEAIGGPLEVLTAAGPMGEDAVRAAGLVPRIVVRPGAATSPADTVAAADALVAAGATLVLFAGGDGTARDVARGLDAVGAGGGARVAALGIPAGVKMYSPVFAVSPRAAGALAAAWLDGGLPVEEREVLDLDEDALRLGRVEPRLHAAMPVPVRRGRTQARKAATPASEAAAVSAAVDGVLRLLRPGVRYLLGPGGTTAELARRLGLPKTRLGVDVVLDGRLLRAAASESELLDEIAAGPARAVVSIIGGQGFLLGRGNQQLSARVLRALGEEPLLVVAPEQKLVELGGRPLLVDTGDPAVDRALAGFVRVVTGPGTSSISPVNAPDAEASSASRTEGEGHAP
ncbi:ATP-NAD kinase family protein [Agromyces soli]|uniref:NAD(+)/NADH kinase n=1 Tax=Agromyces soli TaxID=659012 RepID=A0ABY4ARH7_9MICO|nr:NAD(+)/NADH kinase [Agromyces soli]UOE24796.1 NAD(+)/NADH kinase [Agromyces soli]